jgi:imidazolonepropionase-like amidohydrolase
MSPLEALQAATLVASELAGIEELGELKVGWHADIIGVSRNPVEDISSLQSVDFVMKAGNIVKNVE